MTEESPRILKYREKLLEGVEASVACEIKREELMAKLPGGEENWSMSCHPIYKRSGSLTRQTNDRFNSHRINASFVDFVMCLRGLPPLPKRVAIWNNNGPTSFGLEDEFEEDDKHKVKQYLAFPLWIRLSPGLAANAKFSWLAEGPDGKIYEVVYEVPFNYSWMRSNWKMKEYLGGRSFSVANGYPGAFLSLPLTEKSDWINWYGTTGEENPHDTTIYWHDGQDINLDTFLFALEKMWK